jgi:hypothetical protein
MRFRPQFLPLAILLAVSASGGVANGGDNAPQFLRIRRDAEKRPLALETPILRYQPAKPDGGKDAFVDLVGAIHVGDKAYYHRLNELFTKYDVVLYELVAPEHAAVPTAEGRQANLLTSAQLAMKSMLDLEFQLDAVDYSKPNFVHADLSPAEFKNRMKQRGESFAQMFFRLLVDSMAVQSKHPFAANETAFLAALISKDRSYQLKRLMAKQFEYDTAHPSSLDGPEGSTIISERNKRAMQVLAKQLRAGQRRVAVFYGAAHLRDMGERLTNEFRMKHTKTTWVTAWDLKPDKEPETAATSGTPDEDPF